MNLTKAFCVILLQILWTVNGQEDIADGEQCQLAPELLAEIQSYQEVVNKISEFAVNGTFTGSIWSELAEFTDTFGPRMSGSEALENSIDFLVQRMKNLGLDNVHTEKAFVPHWERGWETAELLTPRRQRLPIIGLGGSVGTPREGIVANVIVVESFAELKGLPVRIVRGSIVVFVPEWKSYGETATYRLNGASEAAKMGAAAALVRSMTPFSIGTLHTGVQFYAKGARRIPAAAITVEDADRLLRMYKRGESISIRLEMEDRNLGDFTSRNVVAELAGLSAQPVVVLSGHIDSWDIGVGAMDDGGGSFISWKALHLIKSLELKQPRRTLRAILWTGEEQGIYGARAYEEQHKANEQTEFNFFFESDVGTFEPLGLDFSGNKEAECIFREVVKLMTPLNATKFSTPAGGEPDIRRWLARGFPGASLLNKNDKYMWFHHSGGDGMLLEDSDALDKNTALFAAAAYVIADLSVDMPRTLVPQQ